MPADNRDSAARALSASLNNAFMADRNLDGLVQSVEQKKKAVSSQTRELEAIEARLRETEERLKQSQPRIPGNEHGNSQRRRPVEKGSNGQENSRPQDSRAVNQTGYPRDNINLPHGGI
ncbi:hypothetical protein MMC12_007179 [Toensbergia leucococca]|nr:hypothetical protein [Toensbergia leucococca]